MSLAWSYRNNPNPFGVSSRSWTHVPTPTPATSESVLSPWAYVVNHFQTRVQVRNPLLPLASSPFKHHRNRRPTDHGALGFGCGVRAPENTPPFDYGHFAQGLPVSCQERPNNIRNLRWQREHLLLTSKNLPDRAPLPDKGKPVVRRGRKATDQISDLTAGLPEED